ncbi:3-dehydroquinate synthase [Neptunicella sp. SCSIO 80796]|uniref:3-dehydroquinate synthase n=1 Tax=Neptunicella plasticusilytica TaxID=3117012 RepID=UPI003A4E2316
MTILTVDLGERSYPIHIDSNLLQQADILTRHLTTSKVVVVTNQTIQPLYGELISGLLSDLDCQWIVLPDGEQYKTLGSFEQIMSQLLTIGAARDTTLIALGGGVIGDITGFAAACYQRGIPFIQIPTTLLAQVDSSVGGKTAVNHPLGKNMIGAFYQPQAVLIDIATLKTLPAREFSAGMAEVIKYGIIYDANFFQWLEDNADRLKQKDAEALAYAIQRSCEVKAEVVALDETEQGIRALLNLGHTFGHAIEAEQGYGNWLHGEAVATGMNLAALAAKQTGWLSESEVWRIQQLLQQFDLPLLAPAEMDFAAFMAHMRRDKKVKAGKIHFVIPQAIGKAVVTELTEDTLKAILN